MRGRWIPLALSMLLLISGCGAKQSEQARYQVCFLSESGNLEGAAVQGESRTLPPGRGAVEGLMQLLLTGPETDGLRSPFPEDTGLRWWRVEDGVAIIDLTEPYGGLTGVDLSLADSCIVLTLCQLDSVDAVYLTVEGKPRPFRDRVIGPGDLLLDNGVGRPEEVELQLCFPCQGGLDWESRSMKLSVGDQPAVAAVRALLEGPSSAGLYFAAPEGTQLLSLRQEKKIFDIDLSWMWLQGEEDPLRVLALASTLDRIEPGARLRLWVEGEPLESWGGLDLTHPIGAPERGEIEPEEKTG